MPIESLSSTEAYNNIKRQHLSRWPDARRGDSRLGEVASVDLKPTFHMHPGEPVFTVGSCFARNIERRLEQLGFNMVTQSISLSIEQTGSKDFNGILNKYTAHSMLNEFRWALDSNTPFDEASYLQAGKDTWTDPHMPSTVPPDSLEGVRERRRQVTELYRKAPSCRVLIITLGLVEAWFDRKTGLYLNGMPNGYAQRLEPDRFRLDVTTVSETLEALRSLFELLKRHGHADFRILITVSPVPMNVSFTGRDVIVANTYSKSALRAAAEEFSALEEVDYFPSYEIVTLSSRSKAFASDYIHVNPDLIFSIMDDVVKKYAVENITLTESIDSTVSIEEIHDLIGRGKYSKAAKQLRALAPDQAWRQAGFEEVQFRFEYGRAMSECGKLSKAVTELEKALALDPDHAEALFQLGLAKHRLGFLTEARADIDRALTRLPDPETFRARYESERSAEARD